MAFAKELEKVKEFYHISLTRYGFANKYLDAIQKKYPQSNDGKAFFIGEEEPKVGSLDYGGFKTTVGEFRTSIDKHITILINNCIILLVSLWENYSRQHSLKQYYDDYITEVILYRNCIVHNNGIIDQKYVNKSKLKRYGVGDKLDFSETDFRTFLKYFEGK
ncbi:MAG TPA: hypothetical protein VMX17_14675 [Candidatus Glassbacteria bacterium]|nr:hypothetical protein [Candidatus Glassbacteria bacterium]